MNKTELVASVAEKAGLTKKQADAAVAAVISSIECSLKKGGKVALVGFGTFAVKTRAARQGRNPATGKAIKIAASKTPSFKAGKAFKDSIQ